MPDETEPISRLNKCCVAAMLHSVRYTMVLSPAWPFDTAGDHVARAAREAAERDLRTEPAVETVS